MLASAALIGLSSAPAWLKLGMVLLLACVATWLWRRPEL
jgi:membrane protein implicated in regulation of membrane protease activity